MTEDTQQAASLLTGLAEATGAQRRRERVFVSLFLDRLTQSRGIEGAHSFLVTHALPIALRSLCENGSTPAAEKLLADVEDILAGSSQSPAGHLSATVTESLNELAADLASYST